jgi:hypothetical protein
MNYEVVDNTGKVTCQTADQETAYYIADALHLNSIRGRLWTVRPIIQEGE